MMRFINAKYKNLNPLVIAGVTLTMSWFRKVLFSIQIVLISFFYQFRQLLISTMPAFLQIRRWPMVFFMLFLTNTVYGQLEIEFTQGQNDHTYTINSACGIIAGGGQNDLDINAGYINGSTLQWQVSIGNQTSWGVAPGPTNNSQQYVLNPLYTNFESVIGVYYFRLIMNGSVTSNIITLNVTASPNLNPGSVSGNQSNCGSFDPNVFTVVTNPSGATGSYSYQWQSSTDNITYANITGATSANYNPPVISQTTYYRRVVVSGGCSATSNFLTVTINPAVSPGPILGTAAVCHNATGLIYSIAAVPNATGYTWAVPTGWNITSGQGTTSITVTAGNAGQNGNISVNVANPCGSVPPSLLAVSVYSPVSLTIFPAYTNIFEGCTGNQIILQRGAGLPAATVQILYSGTATNGVDVQSGGGPLPTVVNFTAGQTTATINYIAVADGIPDAGEDLTIHLLQTCPCSPDPVCSTQTVTIWENNLALTAIANNVSCGAGSSGSITANATNGSGDNLFSLDGITYQASNLFTGLVPGNYTVWAKNVSSCFAPVTTPVTVGVANTILANAGPDVAICSGESVQLQGSGGSIYSWSPSTGLSNANIPNPFASPASTTTYTLTVKDITGNCTSTDNVIVTVNPTPLVVISPANPDICIGNSVTLTASGGVSYVWNSPPGTNPLTVSPASSTSYTVIATGANGCKNDATANVIVHPLPTATLTGTTAICSGSSATLNVALTGTGPWNVTYSANGVTQPIQIANNYSFNFLVSPASTTTYQLVSVTDFWGCNANVSGSGSAVVTVSSLPTPATSVSVDHNNFCAGAFPNITLTANGGSGTSVNWFTGLSYIGTGSSNSLTILAPTISTRYYASWENSCGVSVYTNVLVTIENTPVTPISITTGANPSSYCVNSPPGGIYRIYANDATHPPSTIISGNGVIYQWYTGSCGGTLIPSATTNVLQLNSAPTATTTYWANTINSCGVSGCATITITLFPASVGGSIAGASTVCSGTNNGTLTLSGQTGTIIQWESSTDGGASWPTIIANTTTSLTYTNLAQTTLYRAKVQSGAPDLNACAPVYSSPVTITVIPLPVPSITGPAAPCVNSTTSTYTTLAGMSNYLWTVSAGGTISAGAGTNAITVTWNTTGGQTVSVNYKNANGCTATTPTVYNLTVNPLPIPTITGPVAPICVNSTGNIYTTEASMTNYVWTVAGGTITTGGTTTSNTVTVTWNGTGPYSVSVNYTNSNGCTALNPTVYNVTVNPLPVPTITGPASTCINSIGNIYTTETGMSNYVWTISAGGTITAGAGTNAVTVTWNTLGAQTINVSYKNTNGCTAATPTIYNITVNPLPVPTIVGPATACVNSTTNVYTTETGMSNYVWTISAGGTITAGAGTNAITVTWSTTGAKTVNVNYTNANGCKATTATSLPVTVYTLPVAPLSVSVSLSTPNPFCAGSQSGTYTIWANDATHTNTFISAIPGIQYQWYTGSCGGTLIPGQTTNRLLLNVAPATTTTYYARTTSTIGCGVPSSCASITITVNNIPTIDTQPVSQSVCPGTSVTFTVVPTPTITPVPTYQWRKGGAAIGGATGASFTINPVAAGDAGNYDVVLTNTCGSVTSNAATLSLPPALNTGAHNITPLTECQGYHPDILAFTTAPSGGKTPYTYQWQLNGAAITGATLANYDPSPLVAAGTYSYNCIVTDACGSSQATVAKVITIVPDPTVTITGAGTVCQNAPATLTATINNGTGSYNYKWESGPTATGAWTTISGATSSTYSPPTSVSGTIYYHVVILPTFGACNNDVSSAVAVVVNPNITPTFAAVAAICSGTPLTALPTTSTNGITGTWSPALDNTATTVYTFTPTAGLCATSTTLTITVNPNITPTFAAVAAICSGAPLTALPTTSTNGITGTWSPALNNTATTLYTFTPTAGLCATTTTLTITVNPNITPTFAAVPAICSGAPLTALPTTSTNGITGTWSPALDNTATTLYTFTPTAGLCATTTTLTITVNPNITPTFAAVPAICSGAPLTALPTTSTNGITGTWSPALNNTATTLYTFTPTAGLCATTTTLTITVNPLPTSSIIYHR